MPVEGICVYPILEYPGWENGRHCATGLLCVPDEEGRRRVYEPLAGELARQQTVTGAGAGRVVSRPAGSGRMTRPGSHASADPRPPFPERPLPYVWHYLMRRRAAYGAIFVLTVGAALCAVAVQYGMRLLVDAMTQGGGSREAVLSAFVLFIGLIAVESALWRLGGLARVPDHRRELGRPEA